MTKEQAYRIVENSCKQCKAYKPYKKTNCLLNKNILERIIRDEKPIDDFVLGTCEKVFFGGVCDQAKIKGDVDN